MIPAVDSTAFARGTEPTLQFFTIDQPGSLAQYRGDWEL